LAYTGWIFTIFYLLSHAFIYRQHTGMCHTARHTTGGAEKNASLSVSAIADAPYQKPLFVPAVGRRQTMKTEATETPETTGRDDNACTPQLYRLICINNPGRTTGRRITGRSKKAVVQKGEHPAGRECLMPGIAVGNGESTPTMPKGADSIKPGRAAGSKEIWPQVPEESGNFRPGIPAGSGDLVPEIPEGSADCKPVIPATSGNPGPGTPEGCTDPGPGLSSGSGNLMPQEPAGNKDIGAGSPAPENTGGGAK
jgi:hypothetical protein